MQELQEEASIALQLLDAKSDAFSPLLLTPITPQMKYDSIVRVRVTPSMVRSYPAQVLDRAGDWTCFARALIAALLRKSLTDRLHMVVPLPAERPTWAADEDAPSFSPAEDATAVLCFGLQLNRQHLQRTLDVGPPAESAGVAAFRNFWGEKAELRRFKDGSISEAVQWACPETQRALIFKWIILFTLERHCKLGAEDVVVQADVLAATLCATDGGTDGGLAASVKVLREYDAFAKAFRRLALPLKVMSLQGVSASFRYTEPFPPLATTWHAPLEVLVQMEGSGKWPDHPEAIQGVKSAFYIKMAEAVEKELKCAARVSRGFVDITFNGIVFRLVIVVEHELQLRVKQLDNKRAARRVLAVSGQDEGQLQELDADIASDERVVAAMDKSFRVLPRMTTLLHSVQMRNAAFCGAARLAKRWVSPPMSPPMSPLCVLLAADRIFSFSSSTLCQRFSFVCFPSFELMHACMQMASHMFSELVEEELIDMLVAVGFQATSGYRAPAAAHVGFVRFLSLLASHDFENELLILDPEGKGQCDSLFASPLMVLFLFLFLFLYF